MFRGVHQVTLDDKGRVALPAKFRAVLGDNTDIVLTIDTQEKCLLMYPRENWEVIESNLQSLPSLNQTARKLQRLLIGHATDIQLDSHGRMLLPQLLRDFAALNKQVVVLGQGNKCEIWDESKWQQRRDVWVAEGIAEIDSLPEDIKNISL